MQKQDMTKEQIFATCRDIIRQWGLQHLLMDEVARRRGISKKTIYALFGSKEALLEALMADFLQQEQEQVSLRLQENMVLSQQLCFIIDHLIRLGELIPYEELELLRKKHRTAFDMLVQYVEQQLGQLEALLADAHRHGQLPEAVKPDMALHLLKAQLQYLHRYASSLQQRYALKQWNRQIGDSFLRSLQL